VASVLEGAAADARVPHAAELLEFGEAVLGPDVARQARARVALRAALGAAGLVDAAAIVASFNAVVKLADGTGIPLEDFKAEATRDLRAELGLERFNRGASPA
jgi:hypothetical protein